MRLEAVIVAAVLYAGVGQAAETVRTVPADPRGEVEIVNVSGDVTVTGWDRAEVEVRADLGSGVDRLDVTSDPGHVVINVVLPKGRSNSGSSDLRVHVPRDSRLAIRTVDADQSVRDVRGGQNLQSVSGEITTEVWTEDFDMRSVSGEVVVRGHGGTGTARVNTVSGNVELIDVGSALELTTVTGDLDVKVSEIHRARIKTTNGELELRARLGQGGSINAEAINGDVRIHLESPIDAEFDIETFNGAIDNCFGKQSRRTHEFAPGNELRFTQGSGKGRVRIKTLNGGVEICGTTARR
jgi:DUF4097 and DUF4098 domain-containing protein YvlB